MSETRANPRLYETLLAIKPPELSLNAWTVRAGVSRNAFQDIRNHSNPKRETIEKLLEAINVSPVQFEAALAPVRTEVAGAGIVGANDVHRAFYGEDPLPHMPLYGSAMGSEIPDLDDDIETTELDCGDVLEYLKRPASLSADKDAYVLTIVGDSMEPRYEPGEQVAISPRAPVSIGDHVIVQLKGRDGDDDRIKMVLIKKLVRRSPSMIELRQYNPDKTFQIEARRVHRIHKVAGPIY